MNDVNDQAGTSNPGSAGAPDATAQTSQAPVDLDGLSEFRFQGETYKPEQWHEIKQGYQKYGELSKSAQEQENYWANYEIDIEKVLKDPSRAAEFKQTYPERFHKILDRVLNSSPNGAQSPTQTSQQTNALPKEIQDKIDRLERGMSGFEQRAHQAEVDKAAAKIDAILPALLTKYELADEDKVLLAAEKMLSRGMKLTDAAWERLAKEDHERVQKRADKVYGAKLKEQIQTGQRGADTGAGGGTPGQAPAKPQGLKGAEAAMLAHLRQNKG